MAIMEKGCTVFGQVREKNKNKKITRWAINIWQDVQTNHIPDHYSSINSSPQQIFSLGSLHFEDKMSIFMTDHLEHSVQQHYDEILT